MALAQLAEHRIPNPAVPGSSPGGHARDVNRKVRPHSPASGSRWGRVVFTDTPGAVRSTLAAPGFLFSHRWSRESIGSNSLPVNKLPAATGRSPIRCFTAKTISPLASGRKGVMMGGGNSVKRGQSKIKPSRRCWFIGVSLMSYHQRRLGGFLCGRTGHGCQS